MNKSLILATFIASATLSLSSKGPNSLGAEANPEVLGYMVTRGTVQLVVDKVGRVLCSGGNVVSLFTEEGKESVIAQESIRIKILDSSVLEVTIHACIVTGGKIPKPVYEPV